jgi:V8-like Glu-specific endopeptidase
MRQLKGLFVALFLFAMAASECWFVAGCTQPRLISPGPVLTSEACSVGLVRVDEDGVHPRCGGVWVADEWILTAEHCTKLNDPLTGEVIGDIPTIQFQNFVGSPIYSAHVVYRLHGRDLALAHANTWPLHAVARVATTIPAQGELVHIVGSSNGEPFTYLTGQVAGYRPNGPAALADELTYLQGPYLQLQVPISHGNSGGGAFNERGELIGIADLIDPGLVGEGWFIPAESIASFLKDSHIQ